jgi:hypothetical protein
VNQISNRFRGISVKEISDACRNVSAFEDSINITLPEQNVILNRLKTCVSIAQSDAYEKLVGLINTELSSALGMIEAAIKTNKERETTVRNELRLLEERLNKSNNISDSLITWALPAFGLLVIILLLAPKVYNTDVQSDIFQRGLLLELLTVFLLVASILILGLAERIEQNSLGTLIGGISGFVLGRSFSRAGEAGGPLPPPPSTQVSSLPPPPSPVTPSIASPSGTT